MLTGWVFKELSLQPTLRHLSPFVNWMGATGSAQLSGVSLLAPDRFFYFFLGYTKNCWSLFPVLIEPYNVALEILRV